MEKAKEEKVNPHFIPKKVKGSIVMYRGYSHFLKPQDTFTDHDGRKYRVGEDGSLRRVKE